MLAAIYGEHLHADAAARSWVHYISDGVQAAGFWVLLGIFSAALLPRGTARSVILAACTWGACECGLTAVCGGMAFGGVVPPEQWQGLCGREFGLPLAAIGVTSFAVFIFSMWGVRRGPEA